MEGATFDSICAAWAGRRRFAGRALSALFGEARLRKESSFVGITAEMDAF